MRYNIMAEFPNSIIRSMFAYINEYQLSISMSPSQTFKIPEITHSFITAQEPPIHDITAVTVDSLFSLLVFSISLPSVLQFGLSEIMACYDHVLRHKLMNL
jgi:hypothetical protein